MMFDKKVKKNFGRIRFFLILSSSKSVFLLLSVEIGEDTQAFKGATLKVAFVPVSVGEAAGAVAGEEKVKGRHGFWSGGKHSQE